MENKRFKLASHWEELGASCQKICLREIFFKEIMEITKGWNPNGKFKLLEEREDKIRENKATFQAMEEQWSQKEHILNPSGSQGVLQPNSPVDSYHSGSSQTVAKSHHSSQLQKVSRKRQGQKGKNKTTFRQRKK
ncbi:hypothetical protein O181_094132 [Austropuccinia psidii MF-1]|uniref:Uncharacterized protein n=1 Tax=Austropuccinia psidii MF-1 TaxID=1389203 RepID=A0A9Q3J2U1_9BASI|nr:hypothetical protein [Austropuccinia psidii MF-1]